MFYTHERQRDVTPSKERTMKRGHVTGHKKKRQGSTDWYKEIEEAHIRRIESEWAAKQPGK
jgi:hypothetical protein